jgi:hypothetical protein
MLEFRRNLAKMLNPLRKLKLKLTKKISYEMDTSDYQVTKYKSFTLEVDITNKDGFVAGIRHDVLKNTVSVVVSKHDDLKHKFRSHNEIFSDLKNYLLLETL